MKETLGDPREIAVTRCGLAMLLRQAGELERSLALYEQALADYTELSDARQIAVTHHALLLL
ncbi:MAG: hypothetical protein HC802_04080 [Caldilineaceae bacterium]|nr:hypothetical protein [Caldilineaceae bacterium]